VTTELHHLRRYEFSLKYTSGRKVLDIACGCGFGSFLIGKEGAASLVVGVDIDSDAIRYGNLRYSHPAVQRLVADAVKFKYSTKFDLVVSFETVEHLKNYKEYIQNLSNCLEENGILLISTPINTATTTKLKNPYHEIEWAFSDFHELFTPQFDIEEIYLQNVVIEVAQTTLKKYISKIIKRFNLPFKIKQYVFGKDIEKYRSQYDMNRCIGGYQILVLKKKKK
jgi:cyclopropane fatty-acyl-phospholipid synthase-like methyltransferase